MTKPVLRLAWAEPLDEFDLLTGRPADEDSWATATPVPAAPAIDPFAEPSPPAASVFEDGEQAHAAPWAREPLAGDAEPRHPPASGLFDDAPILGRRESADDDQSVRPASARGFGFWSKRSSPQERAAEPAPDSTPAAAPGAMPDALAQPDPDSGRELQPDLAVDTASDSEAALCEPPADQPAPHADSESAKPADGPDMPGNATAWPNVRQGTWEPAAWSRRTDTPSMEPSPAPSEDTAGPEDPVAPQDPELAPEARPRDPTRSRRGDAAAAPRRRPAKRRKRKASGLETGLVFGGTFLLGTGAMFTAFSYLAPFGAPFDLVSAYRWYWVAIAVLAMAAWGAGRKWVMTALSAAVVAANLIVVVPAMGTAPKSANVQALVVGWANAGGSEQAVAEVLEDADKRGATLVMLAAAPDNIVTVAPGWALIEVPAPGDPTAIAVLSRSGDWRAATVSGEPTFARPLTGTLTVLGVHPVDPKAGSRRTPVRDALINRAATRTGQQATPTLVLGDFNAAAWDGAMRQFVGYGNVTRVRCGGWFGTTYSDALGVFGLAVDHAFTRDLRVLRCQIGARLPQGRHSPLWLTIAPQAAAPVAPPDPAKD